MVIEIASRMTIERVPDADDQPVEDEDGNIYLIPSAGIKLQLLTGPNVGVAYLLTRDEFATILAAGRNVTCDA